MKKCYDIGFKNPCFKEYHHDFLMEVFKTKDEANLKRTELQKLGFIQVIVKMRKGDRALSDY